MNKQIIGVILSLSGVSLCLAALGMLSALVTMFVDVNTRVPSRMVRKYTLMVQNNDR